FGLFPSLDRLQSLATDATIFRVREGNRASRVALVQIDDKSVAALQERYGRVFGWPRSLHARVLRNLIDARARVVVFDLLFDAPGCPTGGESATIGPCVGDEEFAAALEDADRDAAAVGLAGRRVILARAGNPPEPVAPPGGGPFRFAGMVAPIPAFANRAPAAAHIQTSPDADGTVRRLPLVVSVRDELIPAVALQGAAAYLRRPRPFDDLGAGYVLFAGRRIPTDSTAQVLINYVGPPSHRPALLPDMPVPGVSFVDVLQNTFDRSVVEDKVVFVGVTALGFADDFWVPTSRAGVKMTGVEIHAQTAEMLLQGSYLAEQDQASTIAITLGLSLLTGVLLARWQPVLAGATTAICFILYIAAATYYGWSSEQQVRQATTFTVLNSIYPGVGMLGTTLIVLLYRILFEQAEQRATKNAMGKYLSPPVLAEVLRDPDALRLGGQKREMSVLFSDIRGFTPLSENVDPERLVQFLNEYLTAMTDVVFAHQGVLDKYMGDGIMAFWGAPKDQADHATLACRTGYEMVRRLHELQATWVAQGFPTLNIGVGINTGVMTVGNVGSRMRFDYTVVGDAVNLASRLEEANKEYRSTILIGETTYERVYGTFATRELDRVTLRGKETSSTIYELLCPREEVERRFPPDYLSKWDEAITAYRSGDFTAAVAGLEHCLAQRSDDGPALVLRTRCLALAETAALDLPAAAIT
ncbi:MAG: adenylate/guanylate cyclase domain-containing protein, partial [Chloroflexota bacterium]|nr:adenylate/guanylate cyclase domain-containing protein [Chloroflexota bacterium]